MNEREIDGNQFLSMLAGGLNGLKAVADEINDLNVFPIPDGDTGDNMVSTMAGGVQASASLKSLSCGEVAQSAARGMLLGARGNSGVILSQMFAGIAEGLSGAVRADALKIASAFEGGVKHAYASLSDPVEGTILTVMRLASDYAKKRTDGSSTVDSYFKDYLSEAERALQLTPELLPVLKEAGTVDSGGAGLCAIIGGFLSALSGRGGGIEEVAATTSSAAPDISLFTEDSELTFGYCTEFLLRLTRKKTDLEKFSIDGFRERLNEYGNSVVAFRQGSIVKAHVHVMEPWRVLEFAQSFGEFLTLKVENMNIQHSEAEGKKTAAPEFRRRGARKDFGVVAVCGGKGLCEAFRELGADVVIDSEKHGNPSVELLIQAFDAANADTIFVLPDNPNIIVAAEEAAAMYRTSHVRVLGTHNFGEGYVALSALDCTCGDGDEIFNAMESEISACESGMVARAVRDADMNGVSVSRDDYIGISGKKILLAAKDRTDAAAGLAAALGADSRDFIIVFCGADVSEEERAACRKKMEEDFPSAEYYEIDGGQKVYDFIIVLQ